MVAQAAETTTAEPRGASVIVNVIDVLRCFTVEHPVLGVTEIAAQVGLHKSSISRILATLEQERIVARDEATRKYSLGLGLIAVAGPLLANLDVRRVSYPFLAELARDTGETAVLTIWDGIESVSVEQIPSLHQVKHTSAMGSRYNTALSASVQVFLAHEEPDRAADLLEPGSVVLPANTASTRAAYLKRLEEVRVRGYAANYGETSGEEVGVAAPIFDHRGTVVACALVAAPYYRVSQEQLGKLGAACVQAARQISTRLGASPA
ncbi:IclR family transcriptional regulator [Paeniglutamicibacter sp. ZC-3]|uniref:IclR family transcriptional regulator n=1 Tax=Paeniglutamicibacter sp. ZC-3 TaxID=2986919 RepID=UPI0021F766B2|nr:IclR family transcriptional regulator [Paeniglutamicibacter sp. ZC-3]MCV9993168.1 IclR family transcriptional regulator [Paeniglutamicibacter sp. ZC-3]